MDAVARCARWCITEIRSRRIWNGALLSAFFLVFSRQKKDAAGSHCLPPLPLHFIAHCVQVDGPETPWAEWYSPGKLMRTLGRAAAAIECTDDARSDACQEEGAVRTARAVSTALGVEGVSATQSQRWAVRSGGKRRVHMAWCGTIGFPEAVEFRGPDYNWIELTIG